MCIFHRQQYHLLALIPLLLMMYAATRIPGMLTGEFWGVGTLTWFLITIGAVILHQVYVWLCWRSELHVGALTTFLGPRAFQIYAFFAILFLIARPTFVLITGVANQHTLPITVWTSRVLYIFCTILFCWTMYSVSRQFSLKRMLGGDHFHDDLRRQGLVKEGLFRYMRHPMYTVGMLGMWIPGLIFRSQAALLLALFQHLYIWVHYYTLEQPDMEQIYHDRTGTDDPYARREERRQPGSGS